MCANTGILPPSTIRVMRAPAQERRSRKKLSGANALEDFRGEAVKGVGGFRSWCKLEDGSIAQGRLFERAAGEDLGAKHIRPVSLAQLLDQQHPFPRIGVDDREQDAQQVVPRVQSKSHHLDGGEQAYQTFDGERLR